MLEKLNSKRAFLLSVFIALLFLSVLGWDQVPKLLRLDMNNPDSFYKLVLVKEYSPDKGFQYMARDNAPVGTYQHWSAVHSWTMWQAARGLQSVGLAQDLALLVAGAAITWLSLIALLLLAARVVINQGSPLAAVVAVIVMLSSQPLRQYGQLVQITHHIFMLVPLAAATVGLLPSAQTRRHWTVTAVVSGGLLALALWISPETMPLVAVLLATRTVFHLQYPSKESLWPVAAGLCSVLLFAWWQDPPPPTFSAWALDHVSLAWLMFGGLLSALLVLADGLVRLAWPLSRKVAAMAIAACAAALVWLSIVPGALRGPEGLIPAELKSLWWDHINELRSATSAAEFIAWVSMPVTAGILLLAMAVRRRALWLLVLALSAFVYGYLAASHMRMGAAAGWLATVGYGIALAGMAAFRQPSGSNSRRSERLCALFFLVLPSLQLLVAYGLLKNDPEQQKRAQQEVLCKPADIADRLNALPPGIVLSPIDEGPELLWRTRHSIIAGNYHHNVQGLLDHFHIWRSVAPDEDARRLLDDRKVDYIVACDEVPDPMKLNGGKPTLQSRLGAAEAIDWLPRQEKIGHWRLYWRHP